MNEEYENPMDSLDQDSKDVEREQSEKEWDEDEDLKMFSHPDALSEETIKKFSRVPCDFCDHNARYEVCFANGPDDGDMVPVCPKHYIKSQQHD